METAINTICALLIILLAVSGASCVGCLIFDFFHGAAVNSVVPPEDHWTEE